MSVQPKIVATVGQGALIHFFKIEKGELFIKLFNFFKDNITALTIFISFCSLMQLNIYYRFYSIPVYDYISIPELLLKMFYDLVTYSFGILLFLIMSFILNSLLSLKPDWLNVTLSMILILTFAIGFFFFGRFIYFKYGSIILLCCNLGFWLVAYSNSKKLQQFSFKRYMLTSLFFGILLVSILNTSVTANAFYRLPEYHTTEIEFKDGNFIKKGSDEYVVGIVQDYIMTFNNRTLEPSVYSRSDIKIIHPGYLPQSSEIGSNANMDKGITDIFKREVKKAK